MSTRAATITLERMADARNYNAWLLERAQQYLGHRVLDVGAGLGTFTHVVANGRDVVALEPDAEYASRLRARFASRSNVVVLDGDVHSLDVDEEFDSILCLNVLEHVQDDERALAALARALKPAGRLLLLVPSHPILYGAIDEALDHARRYRRHELRTKLVRAGLAVEVLQRVNPVGAVGWFVWGRILRRDRVPAEPLRAYDRLAPVLSALDRVRLPFGLSLWAVARR